jgi:4,5-DOPA dioxygenase extradiol
MNKNFSSESTPVLFIGHGNPMNAIERNRFSEKWQEVGKLFHEPKAILVISAHWLTNGVTVVNSTKQPSTIHDFGGFPKKLYDQMYPVPGSPYFAETTVKLINKTSVREDPTRGLDHGAWSVLIQMYPSAKIPVYQLSIDYSKPPKYHYELAGELLKLRYQGVLIIGSGNIVHNLSALSTSDPPAWAIEFDQIITDYIISSDYKSIINFQDLGTIARIAHPTIDHFLPLLYTIALTGPSDEVSFFNDSFDMGSISMRSFIISTAK